MRIAILAVSALALGLGGCASWDLSQAAAQVERSQCRAEASAWPGAIERCEGIGRGAPRNEFPLNRANADMPSPQSAR